MPERVQLCLVPPLRGPQVGSLQLYVLRSFARLISILVGEFKLLSHCQLYHAGKQISRHRFPPPHFLKQFGILILLGTALKMGLGYVNMTMDSPQASCHQYQVGRKQYLPLFPSCINRLFEIVFALKSHVFRIQKKGNFVVILILNFGISSHCSG